MRVSRIVLLLFLVAQVCDGLFTYVAVSAVGLHAEGNLLLSSLMAFAGPGSVLLGAKLVAAAAGVFVYTRGLHRTLAGLTFFYGVAAVVPWLVVFQRWP
jgi:hypothetical protein